ncbi:hypothetical protein ACA910_006165 [Epithemia clementina (nom. ined.)]
MDASSPVGTMTETMNGPNQNSIGDVTNTGANANSTLSSGPGSNVVSSQVRPPNNEMNKNNGSQMRPLNNGGMNNGNQRRQSNNGVVNNGSQIRPPNNAMNNGNNQMRQSNIAINNGSQIRQSNNAMMNGRNRNAPMNTNTNMNQATMNNRNQLSNDGMMNDSNQSRSLNSITRNEKDQNSAPCILEKQSATFSRQETPVGADGENPYIIEIGRPSTVGMDEYTADGVALDEYNDEGAVVKFGGATNIDQADDDDQIDDENAPIHSVVHEWAQGASMHGIPYISDGATWKYWKRGLYLTLTAGAGAIMIWQIKTLIEQYLNYEVITQTETVNPGSLSFPEVTVCITNLYYQLALDEYNITDPVNETELKLVAHQDYILGTFFNDVEIPDQDLPKFWTPRITDDGMCYSFKTDQKVYRPGKYGGLEFYAYLEQDQFCESTELAGLTVYVEQPGTPIHDQLPFVYISPGKETVATMEVTEFNREREAPWARCQSAAPNYTQPLCNSKCLNDKIRKDCGCRMFGDFQDPQMRYCQPEVVPLDVNCTLDIFESEDKVFNSCNCTVPPCDETSYVVTTTEVEFSEVLYEQLLNEFNITPDEFSQNFVQVRLNYASIKMERLSESKALTREQLLGSIGGSMGLFLGISAISIFEIFGDFLMLRLVPRLFGYRNLHGLGARNE